MTAPAWLDLLDEALAACVEHDRPDLARRVRARRAGLQTGPSVAVVGLPKQGKSNLVNALVNAPICPVGDGPGSLVPVEIRRAARPAAVLYRRPRRGGAEQRIEVGIDRVAAELTGEPGPGLLRAEVGVPRDLLAGGLTLIDTPAVGDPRADGPVLDVLSRAYAVVLVSDASRELSSTEIDLAHRIATWCPSLLVVLTKVDGSPDWARVAERNRDLLAHAGIRGTVLPVSATVRAAAARSGDSELNRRSGFPELLGWITASAPPATDEARVRLAAMCVRAVAEELAGTLRAELDALASWNGVDQVGVAQRTQRAAEELRRHTTRWQNLLADEITDLLGDLEYDLRERTRRIVGVIDTTFDDADPRKVWDDFTTWLTDTLTEAIEANQQWLIERAEWIARAVAATFPVAGADPDGPRLDLSTVDVTDREDLARPRIEPFSVPQKMFTGLRGSYGGVLMFGLVTGLAGLPLFNPISLGAGAAFAAKSIVDEGDVRLKRRQAAAKTAAQRHVDDVFLRFTKEFRDVARKVQRRLRDHFSALTDELAEEINRIREETQTSAARRDRQVTDRRRDLDRLVELHRRAGEAGRRATTRATPRELTG